MDERQYKVALKNILMSGEGRLFILHLLSDCGINLGDGISYRSEKTAHELGLDLLNDLLYNYPDEFKKLVSDSKILKEVLNGRGNNSDD